MTSQQQCNSYKRRIKFLENEYDDLLTLYYKTRFKLQELDGQ